MHIKNMDLAKIAVIIPIHNRKEKTIRCLESLSKIDKSNFSMSIYIIDDGSTDDTALEIKKKFYGTKIIMGNGNLLWTGAINLGIREVIKDNTFTHILFLNDDTIHDKYFLSKMCNCSMRNKKAIIGAKILYLSKPDIIRFSGGRWDFKKWGWYYPNENEYIDISNDHLGEFITEMINGNCCLYPINMFIENGFLDQINFPHYYADCAYTIKAKKYGYTLYIANAYIWDDDSDNTKHIDSLQYKDIRSIKNIFFKKNSPYYFKGLFMWYFLYSKSKLQGLIIFFYKYLRIIFRLIYQSLKLFNKKVNGF